MTLAPSLAAAITAAIALLAISAAALYLVTTSDCVVVFEVLRLRCRHEQGPGDTIVEVEDRSCERPIGCVHLSAADARALLFPPMQRAVQCARRPAAAV